MTDGQTEDKDDRILPDELNPKKNKKIKHKKLFKIETALYDYILWL